MRSVIFSTVVRFLLPLLMVFSLFLFIRGHNEPGGGFIGGLVGAAAFILYSIAYGVPLAKKAVPIKPRLLIAWGLALAALSGVLGILNKPFLTGIWATLYIPDVMDLKVGTPLLFDIGVFMVVVGGLLLIVLTLQEED